MNFSNSVLDPKVQQQASQYVYSPFTESQVSTSQSALSGVVPKAAQYNQTTQPAQTTNTASQTPQTQQSALAKSSYSGSVKPITGSTDYGSDYTAKQASYDDFLNTLKTDVTSKYIGAVPTTNTYANYVEKNPTVTGTAPIQYPKEQPKSNQWKTALTAAGQSLSKISANQQNLGRNEYNSDVAKWEEQGKYWFDKNANLKPDLDKYMDAMPSSLEAIKDSSLSSSLFDGSSDVVEGIGYFGEKAVTGAVAGAAGGWAGAAVGAVVGVVEGIFSWNSSKNEDKKRKKQAQSEYEQKLKEWTYNRNKRLSDNKTARNKEIGEKKTAYVNKRADDKKTKTAEKTTNIATARNNMINTMLSAGSVSSANRTSRLQRWK
jgi:hypothetical protein